MTHYNRVRNLGLTAEQQRDLVEYLKSLHHDLTALHLTNESTPTFTVRRAAVDEVGAVLPTTHAEAISAAANDLAEAIRK